MGQPNRNVPLPTRPSWLLPVAGWTLGISYAALAAAYWVGSWGCAYWNKMFNQIPGYPPFSIGVFGIGWFAEAVRALIIIYPGVVCIGFGTFRSEAMQLMSGPSQRPDDGPHPSANVVRGFRLIFTVLGIALMVACAWYHMSSAPLALYELRGNEDGPRDHTPPRTIEEYRCINYCYLSYFFYMFYSLVIWLSCFLIMFSIVSFSVTKDTLNMRNYYLYLFNYIDKNNNIQAGEKIVIEYDRIQKKAQSMLTRYFSLVTLLLLVWAYLLWVDRYNLTNEFERLARMLILVFLYLFAGLLIAFYIFHDTLVKAVKEAIPMEKRKHFTENHRFLPLLWATMRESDYFKWMWILVVLILIRSVVPKIAMAFT